MSVCVSPPFSLSLSLARQASALRLDGEAVADPAWITHAARKLLFIRRVTSLVADPEWIYL